MNIAQYMAAAKETLGACEGNTAETITSLDDACKWVESTYRDALTRQVLDMFSQASGKPVTTGYPDALEAIDLLLFMAVSQRWSSQ
jgi:hypothetical protein